jgi:hypothetical protein
MKNEIEVELLARINLAVLTYYQKAEEFKTQENYGNWLKSITHESLRTHFEELGFEASKNAIPFMRFILELNDIGLYEHLKCAISEDDYQKFINPNKDWVVPNEMNIVNLEDLSKLV